jgi:hypothetical protein
MKLIVQVLLVIAIVIASAQIFAITVELFTPPEDYETSFELATALRWKVYWFAGLPILGLGLWLHRRYELVGLALSIAGVNAMLVGNNGGLSSIGYEGPRLTTAIITLFLLVGIAFVASKNSS